MIKMYSNLFRKKIKKKIIHKQPVTAKAATNKISCRN